MASQKTEILNLVKEFIELNDARRKKTMPDVDVDKWFTLKQKIEEKLFSRPPRKDDNRRFIRVQNLNLNATYASAFESYEGQVREVSEGGMFLATSSPLPPGTELQVSVSLPPQTDLKEAELHIPTRVVYTNSGDSIADRSFSGMGLAISDGLSPADRKKWISVVQQFLRDAVDLEY